jgi:hypothetical protein
VFVKLVGTKKKMLKQVLAAKEPLFCVVVVNQATTSSEEFESLKNAIGTLNHRLPQSSNRSLIHFSSTETVACAPTTDEEKFQRALQGIPSLL